MKLKSSKLFIFIAILAFMMASVCFADALKVGSKGAEVKKLQQTLKVKGFFKSEVTGYFGSETKKAVEKFQKSKGLTADGIVGTKTEKLLYGNGTSSSKAVKTVTTASTSKEKLIKVQTELKKLGLYKGKIDGTYGSLTQEALRKYQKSKGLKVTGKIDAETEKKLLSALKTVVSSRGSVDRKENAALEANASEDTSDSVNEDENDDAAQDDSSGDDTNGQNGEAELKGELLDWWSSASKIFARGDVATVIDVATGKSFRIKRTYGRNHADCETLTKEDTIIMKEIWGGSWSWNRRAVIVVVNGKKIAASAAGMPHAGIDGQPTNKTVRGRSGGFGTGTNLDAVQGNGMDGHFDIHFLNSRTHGSNRVDTKHQKMVLKAAGK